MTANKTITTGIYKPISEIIKYINNNYCNSITIPALAEKVFLSEFYMCRLFKECTGMTITEYITTLRLTKAKKLLSETNIKINALYKSCGFKSLSNFNRSFKKHFGISPGKYRFI